MSCISKYKELAGMMFPNIEAKLAAEEMIESQRLVLMANICNNPFSFQGCRGREWQCCPGRSCYKRPSNVLASTTKTLKRAQGLSHARGL